jgi:hypothetical protein
MNKLLVCILLRPEGVRVKRSILVSMLRLGDEL